MRGLHTIGEFSRLTGFTVKALRHYDRHGVLRPARVDPRTGDRDYEGVAFGEVEHLLGDVGGAVHGGGAGPAPATPGLIWHDCGKLTGRIDCEGLLLVGDPPPAAVRSRSARIRRLPPTSTACVVHHGSDGGISQAYAAVERWAAAQGYRVAGPIREWYLEGAADGPDTVTEIHLPIVRASVG